MNSIKYVAGAFVAGALAVAAVASADGGDLPGRADSQRGRAEQAARAAAPAQQSSTPIATAEGSEIHTSVALMHARRTGPKVVTVRLRVSLRSRARREWLPELEGDGGTWYTAEGVRLVDEVHGREHFPLTDADDDCLCSADIHHLAPGETIGVSAKFPAPPAGVDRVSIHVPGFQSLDGVPLQP